MAQVNVSIGGRSYSVSCNDGDEARVARLAHYIHGKAEDLTNAIGSMSEPRLLLMSSLMIADELFELKEGGAKAPSTAAPADLGDLVQRVEALAAALETEQV